MSTAFRQGARVRKKPVLRALEQALGPIADQPTFLLWRTEDGKKIPYYANGNRRSGRNGSPEDCQRLVTLAGAERARQEGKFDGIGIATQPGNGLVVIDLDDCIDEQGDPSELAEELSTLSYTETSVSGRGRHVFFAGEYPNRKGAVETFHSTGWVTLTGHVVNDSPIQPLTPAIRARLDELTGAVAPAAIPEGRRNDHLFRMAVAMRHAGKSEAEIRARLLEENRRCTPPLPESEVLTIVASNEGYRDTPSVPAIFSLGEFTGSYEAPTWVLRGVLAKGYVYAFTAMWGHGKTAISITLSLHIATGLNVVIDETRILHVPSKLRVLYLMGENADDGRGRVIAALRHFNISAKEIGDRLQFTDRPFPIDDPASLTAFCSSICDKFDLVVVDTGPAHASLDDENDNMQMKKLAQACRTLARLPGGPAVLILMHPTKSATKDTLQPRGGGAFSAEVDGLLYAWKDASGVEFFHGAKLRGPGFDPIRFQLVPVELPEFVDNFSDPAQSIVAVPCASQVRVVDRTVQLADLLHDMRPDGAKGVPLVTLRTEYYRINKGWSKEEASKHSSNFTKLLERAGLNVVPDKSQPSVAGKYPRIVVEGGK